MTIFVFEGNISSGKSHVSRNHTNFLTDKATPATLQGEVVNETFLTRFYQNPKKYAFSFQLFMQDSRQYHILTAIDRKRRGIHTNLDRGPFGDYAFAIQNYESGMIDLDQFNIYLSLFQQRELVQQYKEVNSTLYLHVEPETCFERKNRRNHDYEKKVPIKLFQTIDDVYFRIMMGVAALYPRKVHFLDWSNFGTPQDIEEENDKSAPLVTITNDRTVFEQFDLGVRFDLSIYTIPSLYNFDRLIVLPSESTQYKEKVMSLLTQRIDVVFLIQ